MDQAQDGSDTVMDQLVLVINTGSSSLKYSLVDATSGAQPGHGLIERIGEPLGIATHTGPDGQTRVEAPISNHEEALRLALLAFQEHGPSLESPGLTAIGHRVVHGGSRFSEPAVVNEELLNAVRELVPLAPLHNPANIEGMEVALRLFPDVPQVAVFDTAFHHTMPEVAYTYAVPLSWRDEHGIRRYGFHGTSIAFVSRAAAELLEIPPERANLIVLHLGNGASATAVEGGRSVDSSMGLTPLEGLVMGTRSGDIDPALPAHLNRELGWSIAEIDTALNRESGLRGLVGYNDVRELVRSRNSGDPAAELAFDIYCRRIRKYVGAYAALLERVDAVVFTGGVGENSPDVRATALSGLDRMGIKLDTARNGATADVARSVSSPDSPVAVLVVPTDEEWEIAQQTLSLLEN